MNERAYVHTPVLLDDVVELLAPRPGARFLDGTLGGGGHAEALLARGVRLDAFDRDASALQASALRLADALASGALRLHHAAFGDAARRLFDAGAGPLSDRALLDPARLDGVLLDLGVSSPQLDRADRGFSFQADGPVSMVMDSRDAPLSERLTQVDEPTLTRVIRDLGDEPNARRVAQTILFGRPWAGTRALAEAVAAVAAPTRGTHRATRTFQALRIWVNDELGQLDRALADLPALLAPGGRFAVISFHSLEDRRVKQAFATLSGDGAPKDLYGHPVVQPAFRLVERRARKGE
ncbi:MAG: 16S rRNA (cytosine(1402)-N(4))-methyltransferase, partial [Myxococcales bacterium]|nr:16S rRNA (cytosine(1402)-N(4))-methyltransferase [Myxococcales bacterium]